MSFALDLGADLFKVDGDDEDHGQLSAPFAWLMFMHCLFLGDSDAGKTLLVLNILWPCGSVRWPHLQRARPATAEQFSLAFGKSS